MLKKAIVIGAIGALTGTFYEPAKAQGFCGKTEDVETFLRHEFNEIAILEAPYRDGMTWQMFTSPASKTASIVLKRPDGMSCMIDALEGLAPVTSPRVIPPKPKTPPPEVKL